MNAKILSNGDLVIRCGQSGTYPTRRAVPGRSVALVVPRPGGQVEFVLRLTEDGKVELARCVPGVPLISDHVVYEEKVL